MKIQEILQNRYKIESVLGRGGMGTVHLAKDMRLDDRLCVIKELRDDFYRDEDRERALGFFDREARMLARLKHANIVQVSDYFSENGKYYLVMEYVEGKDLHTVMQEREAEPFSEEQVINWAIQITEVLSYLHSQVPPVIYRDLKPSNIMINSEGHLKLVDFGIARKIEHQGQENTRVVSAGYSPPEQYWGGACPQSDIYALGATMYFLLTGKDPEPLNSSSVKAVNSRVSTNIDEIIVRCLCQEISQRFASAIELREALLRNDFEEEPDNPKSWFTRAVAAVLFIIAFSLVFIGWEPILNSFRSSKVKEQNTEKTPMSSSLINSSKDDLNGDQATLSSKDNIDTFLGGVSPQKNFALQVTDEKKITDPDAFAN